MNDAFFSLPEEKRDKIIKSALRVFARNGYKKSPMNEIASEAGISKSLLFYYFRNKKELYLYLADYCARLNEELMKDMDCEGGFFDMLETGLRMRIEQMRQYPELALFEMKGYFENAPELKEDIKRIEDMHSGDAIKFHMMRADPSEFIEGLDIEMMYRTIYYAAVGFLWEIMSEKKPDLDKMEQGYLKLIDHWRKIYLR